MIFSLILITSTSYVFAQMGSTTHIEDPIVVLETKQGEIIIEFFHIDAPNHVQNFILLTENKDFDGILFHRIIPGFMIQSGDPNTIDGDPNTWGQGGKGILSDRIDAEFNNIQHNRGIVSMARSSDPNSAGSQFFIVHKDSTFLDGEYTVFGRIVTESSFETLDKITSLQTSTNDRPINPEQAKIIKATVVERSEISDILELSPPIRTDGSIISTESGYTTFENQQLDVKFSAPVGWLLQQPEKTSEDAPDVVAVGPKVDGINPYISLTIKDVKGKTINDLITEKNQILDQAVYQKQLEIISQQKIKSNVYQTEAIGSFTVDNTSLKIKFIEAMIFSNDKLYTFAYSNTIENFDDELAKFNESLSSFEIPSQQSSESKSSQENTNQQSEAIFQDPLNDPQNLNEQILVGIVLFGAFVAPILIEIRFMNKWSKEYNIKSTTKKPVNIKWQIVFLFVPIVRLWAYSRINKFGFGLLLQLALMGIMFGSILGIGSILTMINP